MLSLSPNNLTTWRQVHEVWKNVQNSLSLLALEIQEWLFCVFLSVSTPQVLSQEPDPNLSLLHLLIREASSPCSYRGFVCFCLFLSLPFSWLQDFLYHRQSFYQVRFLARWGWGVKLWRLEMEREKRGLLSGLPSGCGICKISDR